jgi:iron complex outermembrane recepter protein
MTKFRNLRTALIASVSCTMFAPVAFAQTEPAAEDTSDIVVVAMRQQYIGDTPLKEIPQSVQILDAALLDDINANGLTEALELASGVSQQNNFGGLWDSFAIRGFAGDENFPSGFLVNGFNGGRGYSGPRDASNVERIEVLKGPNSALFGRGEPGGTVNIVTRKPQFEQGGSFSLSAGSWNNYRVEGDFTGPITDSIAFRINGAVEDADSFRDTIHTRKYVVTPSVLAQITPETLFSYELEYVNQEVPFDRGVVAIDGELGVIPQSRFLGSPLDGPIEVEVLGHQAQLQHDFSKDWGLLLGFGQKETWFEGFSTDPELAGLDEVGGRQRLDDDGMTLSRQRRHRDYNTQHMTVRGEIAGKLYTGGIVHNIKIGADWDKFELDLVQRRYRPTAADQSYSINIFDPDYSIIPPTPNVLLTDSFEVQKAWGVYFQNQMDIGEQLKVRFGGRYDDFSQNVNNRINSTIIRKSYTKFSPTAGIVFEPTKTISLYASYGKGFRPNSGLNFQNELFDPEISESYEVGGKYVSPGGGLTGTLSLFKMKKSQVLISDTVNVGFTRAGGSAESQGVEFDLNAKLPAGFEVFATYSYVDAEWSEDVPDQVKPIVSGDPLINIAKHQANLLVFNNFMIGDAKAMLGGGVNYVGKRLGEVGTDFFLPSYTLVKLMASIEPVENVKISADIHNLFDKRYYPSSFARLWVQPGMPRAFTVRASFSF